MRDRYRQISTGLYICMYARFFLALDFLGGLLLCWYLVYCMYPVATLGNMNDYEGFGVLDYGCESEGVSDCI